VLYRAPFSAPLVAWVGTANFAGRVEKGTLSQEKLAKILSLLSGTLEIKDFGTVDLVIEVSTE